MTEFQAAILLAQMKRLEEQTQRRWENANYLSSKLKEIPGITPHRLNDGVTRPPITCIPSGMTRSSSTALRAASS